MCGELGLGEPLRKQEFRAVGGDDKARGCGSVVVKTKGHIASVMAGKRARVRALRKIRMHSLDGKV